MSHPTQVLSSQESNKVHAQPTETRKALVEKLVKHVLVRADSGPLAGVCTYRCS
jgi:hypothetical protein